MSAHAPPVGVAGKNPSHTYASARSAARPRTPTLPPAPRPLSVAKPSPRGFRPPNPGGPSPKAPGFRNPFQLQVGAEKKPLKKSDCCSRLSRSPATRRCRAEVSSRLPSRFRSGFSVRGCRRWPHHVLVVIRGRVRARLLARDGRVARDDDLPPRNPEFLPPATQSDALKAGEEV